MVVRQRRELAETLGQLTPEQFRQPSLCAGWSMHDIAAHLTTYLRFGQLKLYLGIVATAADIDRINLTLTRWAARRPTAELIETLHRRAKARTTIPRSGFDPVLTDAVLHDLDIRLPLGIRREVVEEHRWVAFNHLARNPALGYSRGPRLTQLELVATDAGWRFGSGAAVRGPAEALLLTMSGRDRGWDQLDGDGPARAGLRRPTEVSSAAPACHGGERVGQPATGRPADPVGGGSGGHAPLKRASGSTSSRSS